MTKVDLPNLYQTVVGMFLIINFNNSSTSTSFELLSSHARVTLIKFARQEWVSESVSQGVSQWQDWQWSDSGPIKRNNWVHLIKNKKRNWDDTFGNFDNWPISPRDFLSSKSWISKKYTLFHFLWKTTSFTHLTQFYIPSQNELIWKTPFFTFSILASGKTVRPWTIFSWTWIFLQIHPQQNE